MWVDGIGRHPVGTSVGQSSQDSMALQAFNEKIDWPFPAVRDEPQPFSHFSLRWSCHQLDVAVATVGVAVATGWAQTRGSRRIDDPILGVMKIEVLKLNGLPVVVSISLTPTWKMVFHKPPQRH